MSQEIYRKSFAVEPGTVLKVFHKTGHIHVTSWDRDTIEVVAVKQMAWLTLFLKEPVIDVAPNQEFVVRTLYSWVGCQAIPIHYRMTVPKSVLVEQVETSTGRIILDKVSGNLSAVTATGEIQIREVNGSVKVVTRTGKVTVDHVSGDVDAQAATGEIHLHEVKGFVKAVTRMGNIEIAGIGGLSEARADTGKITVEVPAIRDSAEIITGTGGITVFLSPQIAARLEASTGTGKITYGDLPLAVNESSGTKLTGQFGAGSGLINLKTTTGSINIKKLVYRLN